MFYKIGPLSGTGVNFTLNGNFNVIPSVIGELAYKNVNKINVKYSYAAGSGGGINGTISYLLSSGVRLTSSTWRSYWSESTGTGSYTIRPDMLFYTDETITDARITPVETVYISGKYRLNPVVGSVKLKDCGFNVNVSLIHSNGVLDLSTLLFPKYNEYLSTSDNAPTYFNKSVVGTFEPTEYIGGFRTNILNSKNITNADYVAIKDKNGLRYDNIVLDFGTASQPVPRDFSEWLSLNGTAIYDYTFTVKSQNGNLIYASLNEAPAMVDATPSATGNVKTLTMTGANGQTYTMTWESETPAGKQFLGLAYGANEPRASIPTARTTPVTWDGSLTIYEAYGTYRPPVTTFDINLYQSSAEVNRVDKTKFLTGVGTLSGVLREECSIIAPSITFKQTPVPSFNYVYIAAFGRYYYVTGITSVSKDIWRMSLSCDVLMTWKGDIRALTAIIARQENSFNPLLLDSELPAQANQNITVTEFPAGGFSTDSAIAYPFILTVVGA